MQMCAFVQACLAAAGPAAAAAAAAPALVAAAPAPVAAAAAAAPSAAGLAAVAPGAPPPVAQAGAASDDSAWHLENKARMVSIRKMRDTMWVKLMVRSGEIGCLSVPPVQ